MPSMWFPSKRKLSSDRRFASRLANQALQFLFNPGSVLVSRKQATGYPAQPHAVSRGFSNSCQVFTLKLDNMCFHVCLALAAAGDRGTA